MLCVVVFYVVFYVCVVLSPHVPHSGFDLFGPVKYSDFAQWIYALLLVYSSID